MLAEATKLKNDCQVVENWKLYVLIINFFKKYFLPVSKIHNDATKLTVLGI